MNGKELAIKIRLELKDKVLQIKDKLKLVVIQVGDLSESNMYIKNKEKACLEAGILFDLIKLENDIKEEKLLDIIKELNESDAVTSILVQMPLPNHINYINVVNSIDPHKDVDGLSDINVIKLINNQKGIIPCTPKGVITLLERYNVPLKGSNVTVIGRSMLVGRPLSNLLINKDATVTLCHSKTNNLKDITKNSDIIVSAVGKKHLINKEYIKENAVLIDVGINIIDGKLYGDIDYNDCLEKTSMITPVPGGVGPMTIAMLIENIIECYELKKETN
jgi:methylenetetrahydrofolate dehydrogenase (NADP+) / methenyltetrahydrofolate cyclohydrolase